MSEWKENGNQWYGSSKKDKTRKTGSRTTRGGIGRDVGGDAEEGAGKGGPHGGEEEQQLR